MFPVHTVVMPVSKPAVVSALAVVFFSFNSAFCML